VVTTTPVTLLADGNWHLFPTAVGLTVTSGQHVLVQANVSLEFTTTGGANIQFGVGYSTAAPVGLLSASLPSSVIVDVGASGIFTGLSGANQFGFEYNLSAAFVNSVSELQAAITVIVF
jgi:hypothetical protein